MAEPELGYQEQMKLELEAKKQMAMEMNTSEKSVSSYGSVNEDNLIRWQLDLSEELDRIYHLLKGHKITIDGQGNITYQEEEDKDKRPFNDYGVQLIMNVMTFYLNRNTILSNYNEKTINWKVFDFGVEMSDLIFNKYQEMGMDTPDKLKLYPMVVRELVDTVHSAYLRALNGGERNSLRTARSVHQTEGIGGPNNNNQVNSINKFKWNKPTSWV